jgi:hypothetical protein
MAKYAVPITFYINADSPEQAAHHGSMIVRNLQGVPFMDAVPQADQGTPEFVPEVMDPASEAFRDGYGDQIAEFPAEYEQRVTAAFEKLQELQPPQTQEDYGRLKACQEVIDEARKRASGGSGFGATPDDVKARIDAIKQGGW